MRMQESTTPEHPASVKSMHQLILYPVESHTSSEDDDEVL